MPFVGTGHMWMLAILGVIALVIFGPGRLPEMGSGLGRAIREFRQATSGAVAAPAPAAGVIDTHPVDTAV